MVKKGSKILIIGILVLVILWADQNILERTLGKNPSLPNLPLIKGEEQGGGLDFTAIKNSTVYDFMRELRAEGKINFTDKTYTGIGKFITSINGTQNSGEQSWIYYVNGKEAQVGVSNYKLKVGDIVSWKYEKANY